MTGLTVAAIQHDIVWENPEANIVARASDAASAAAAGADMIVFSEMFTTGFSMAAAQLAETPDGPSTSFLVDTAAYHGLWAAGSIPELTPGFEKPTNRFIMAGPDSQIYCYSKMRPFSLGGEHEHYSAGVQRVTINVSGVRVTPFVCYDLRFADLFWDAAADTDCFVVVANWPAVRRTHWTTLLKARAIENQAYVVGVNRVGVDGNGLAYSGDSTILSPLGTELASADNTPGIITARIDPTIVADVRTRFPFLTDR